MLQITPKRLGNVCKTFVFTLFVCSFFLLWRLVPLEKKIVKKKQIAFEEKKILKKILSFFFLYLLVSSTIFLWKCQKKDNKIHSEISQKMDLLKKHRYSTYVSIIRTCFSHHQVMYTTTKYKMWLLMNVWFNHSFASEVIQ